METPNNVWNPFKVNNEMPKPGIDVVTDSTHGSGISFTLNKYLPAKWLKILITLQNF